MERPLIEVRNVSKSFRIPSVRRETVREHILGLFQRRPFQTLDVLRDVSLEVRRGETVGIMGRNGSGKSTLLKLMCGIYPTDGGTVIARAPIMPVLQLGIGWNPDLDAVDNILIMATIVGMSLQQARAAVDEILAFAGLEQFANLEVRHFSSGMAARLSYAVAFKAVRDVLVLDEIFAVGDAGFVARCVETFRRLSAQGVTVVLVSHEADTVATFCSRALLLEGGRIALSGSGQAVAAEYLRVASRDPRDGTLA